MNYATGRASRQALERRLQQQSLQAATPLVRLRKLVAFDRFLARLARAQPETRILKGGLALQLRLAEKARLTKDVDLLLCQPLAEALTRLRRAASVDLGDWFAFEIAEATPAPEHTQATVRRFPVHSLLDGRTFEDFHVNVGVGDPVVDAADMLVMQGGDHDRPGGTHTARPAGGRTALPEWQPSHPGGGRGEALPSRARASGEGGGQARPVLGAEHG
ncbi:MAG: nucleotidyl transferase AbiEii/AbiGii toxin family protein [Anaerolineales bacterium]|nr:nucleotidyl transferase AbiEii/AbiGii toxin family protein [Anaerolineales bacterium]